MTRLANTTLKGMNINEVKELVKKERRIGKNRWNKYTEEGETVFQVEYDFDKYLFCTVDNNNVVVKVDKLNLN